MAKELDELQSQVKSDLSEKPYRYGIHDPSNGSQYRMNTADEMIAKANEFNATQVKSYTADGQESRIHKVGDQWIGEDGKTLTEIQAGIDQQSVKAIMIRSQLRTKVGQNADHDTDRKLAFADTTAFLRIQDHEQQKAAAAIIANSTREFPDYKAGLELAYTGYLRNPPKISAVSEKVYAIDRGEQVNKPGSEQANQQRETQAADHSFTVKAGNRSWKYTDAKKAGAAYYRADPEKKPSVIHAENNRGRIMASTEIHGTYEDGQTRYYKSVPDVRPVDKEFQAGFNEELEKTVRKHLKTLKGKTQENQEPEKLDDRLAADLKRFAKIDPDKALKTWQKYAPEGMPTPAYLENQAMGANSRSSAKEQKTQEKVISLNEKAPEINHFEYIDVKEAVANANKLRQREQHDLNRKNKQITIENPTENRHGQTKSIQENIIAFYDKTQEKSTAGPQQTPASFPENTGNNHTSTAEKQAATNDIPERVASRYIRLKNQYYFLDKTLAFEDGGKKLKLETENVTVIRDALSIAENRSWQTITVSGTDNFKHQVWREASLKGIEVVGYKPTGLEQAELEKTKAAQEEKGQTSNGPQGKTTTHQGDGIINGILLAHGSDHYKHDKNEKGSYYVKLDVDGQERTIWGVDLDRAVNESETNIAIGDDIKIKNIGQRDVTVMVDVLDDKKNKIGVEEKTVKRNSWLVEKAESFDEILKKDELAQAKSSTQEPLKAQAIDKNPVDQQHQPHSNIPTDQHAKIKQRDDATTGILVAHGADHYKHDPNNGKSYFVTMEVDGKEVTKWGTDLKRALAESHSKPEVGDKIVLSSVGKENVNIPTTSRDDAGNEVKAKKSVQKNTWRIEKEDYQITLEEQAEALRTGKEIEQKIIAQIPQVAAAITAAKLGEKIAEQAHKSGVIKSEDEKSTLVYLIREGLAAALEKGKKITAPEIKEQGKQATIDANNVFNDRKPPVMTKEPADQAQVR